MKNSWRQIATVVLVLCCMGAALSAAAMDYRWVRTTGQEPVEGSPIVLTRVTDNAPTVLTLNRLGQLMAWDLTGKNIGQGQDGTITTLPEGRWTTSPVVVPNAESGAQLLVCSVEGLLLGLDKSFQPCWRYTLPGKTTWARAIPTFVRSDSGQLLACIADESGVVSALSLDGKLVWSTRLDSGPCKAPVQTLHFPGATDRLLATSGSTLACLDAKGSVIWTRKLGGEILSQPEILEHQGKRMILCGAGSGSIYATTLGGEPIWETPVGAVIDSTITVIPRENTAPLIVFTGVWGNVYALDSEGRRVWTYFFRSKTRCKPQVIEADGHNTRRILVSAYNQHIIALDMDGALCDDLRLQGAMTQTPVPLADGGKTDYLVTTALMLAYRVSPTPPTYSYGVPASQASVTLRWSQAPTPSLMVTNPTGALIRVNLSMSEKGGHTYRVGSLTARSEFELPLPSPLNDNSWSVIATAQDCQGAEIAHLGWEINAGWKTPANPEPTSTLSAWATPPYGEFDEQRLAALDNEAPGGVPATITVNTLYKNEFGQGAFVVASTSDAPMRVRVTVDGLKRDDKAVFAGNLTLRQAIPVPTLNGEYVADALPELPDGGVVTIPARRSVKLWCSVDGHGAEAGAYSAALTVTPLNSAFAPAKLDLRVTVLDLSMPAQFPLRLCTWDYVPNPWNPNESQSLDDMNRHGVSVFPRSTCLPRATADANGGALAFDYGLLDQELARLKGRGQILFQIGIPTISFAVEPAPDRKRAAQIAYLHAFRDYLKQHGLDYDAYAFYPVDEPGLDYGKSLSNLTDAAELFREADPKFRIYTDPVPSLSWKDFQRIDPLIDVWCPNMRLVSGLLAGDPRIKRIMESGKAVWSYECVGQVKSLSPLRYNRADAWRASFFGLQGIGMWTHSTTPADMWQTQTALNDEYALVYPGGAKPVPSVRWEALRDGMEDIAAVRGLEDAIAQNKAKGTKPELVGEAQDALRIAQADIMELSDIAYMESRDFLNKGDRRIWHTWTDATLYEKHRARIAELTLKLR